MTERFNLTNRGQNPYPESGDIFMTNEPGSVEDQSVNPQGQESQESQFTNQPTEAVVSLPERSQSLRDAWARHIEQQASTDPDERHAQDLLAEEAIRRGLTPEEAIGGEPPEENENEEMRARMAPILDKLYAVRPGAIMEDIIDEIPPEDREQISALLSGAEARAAQSEDLQELDAKIAEYRRDNAEFANLRIPAEILVQIGEGEISLIQTSDGLRVSVPERFYAKWIARVELERAQQGYRGHLRRENLGFPTLRFANQLRDILEFTYPPTDSFGGEASGGREETSGRPAEAGGAGGGGERPPRRPTATGGEGGGNEEVPEPPIISDEDVLGILRRADAQDQYARTEEERFNALREAAVNLRSLPDKELPEGVPSFASQRTFVRLGLEERMRVAATRSAEALAKEFEQRSTLRGRGLTEEERDTMNKIRNAILSEGDDSTKMEIIENIIKDELDPNERSYPHILAEALKGIEGREHDPLIEDVLEYSLERFLSRADAQPLEDYPQFTFTESENISMITQAGRRFDEIREAVGMELGITPGRREMFKYLTTLSNRRRIMHEIFKGMNDLESYTGLVTRALRKSGMSFVEKQLVGVSDIQIDYDKVFLSMKSLKLQNKGWLLEEDFDEADRRVERIFADSVNNHSDRFNRSYIDANGNMQTRPLRKWEIERAFHMGRDISGASQRRVVYGILGDVPKNADELLKSVGHEPIARRLAPLKLLPDRFFNQPIAVRFLQMLKHEQKRKTDGTIDNYKYGYVVKDKAGRQLRGADGEPVTRGFFGGTQGESSIMDLSITDLKSNSWRARLMFLKNPLFGERMPDGRRRTIGEYLDSTKDDALEAMGNVSRKERHHRKSELIRGWNDSIRDKISEQRLFLGVLVRYSDLDEANKAIIWKNTARFQPSMIASLFPNETLRMFGMQEQAIDGVTKDVELTTREQAQTRWEVIAEKLWLAERMRVTNDAKTISTGEGALYELDHYFGEAGLNDPAEIAMVRRLQALDLGYQTDEANKDNYAQILAHGTFPFTAFLDDAPETAWEELSDYDFTRLLVNDQNSYQEGFGGIIGLADNPVKKIEDANKILIEAFDKAKGPPGIERMQEVFEPIVRTTYKMRQMKQLAKWAGETLMRLSRKPTSIIEEYNLSAGIADAEKEQADGLTGLAQAEVLNDDPDQVDEFGRTQFFRARHDLDADRLDVLLGFFRLLFQMGLGISAEEFAKTFGLKL